MTVVNVENLIKVYNEEYMLDKLNFSVPKGSFFAVIGPENAGKTPLLEMIAGLKKADSGEIVIAAPHNSRMVYVPDDIACYDNMTAAALFERTMRFHDIYDSAECELLSELFGIDLNEKLMDMTYNQNKCAVLINALMSRPDILILDEPYNFLTEENYQKLLKVLKRRCSKGMTIIISCEKFKDVNGFCDHYIYIKEGDQVRLGEISDDFRPWKMITFEDGSFEPFKAVGASLLNLTGKRKHCIYRSDMNKLAKAIIESECSYFLVEELTMEEQLFFDFERWN